jgi:hypothetical protein
MLSDRDKEQALVAAAYRVASIYVRDYLYEYSSTLDPDGLHDDIISIIPADAEAKLRELMVKVIDEVWATVDSTFELTSDVRNGIVDRVLEGK